MGIALGCVLASASSMMLVDRMEAADGASGEFVCTLTADPSVSAFGSNATAQTVLSDGTPVAVQLSFNGKETGLLYGDRVVCRGTVRAPDEEWLGYYRNRGLAGRLNVTSWEAPDDLSPITAMRSVRRHVLDMFSASDAAQAPLMMALACGYRAGIVEDGTYDAFKAVGLAHVVAVSGAHLALVVMIIGGVLSAMGASRRCEVVVSCIAIGAYLVLSGVPISALRAAFMAASSLLALCFSRRSSSLNALALCVVVFIAADPVTAVSVSFFLSAGSTFGIIMFSNLFTSWFSGLPERFSAPIVEPCALTMSSGVVTVPFSAALFSSMPVISLLANVVTAPLFIMACLGSLSAGIAGLAIPSLASEICAVGSACCTPLSAAVSALCLIPYGRIPVDAEVPAMLVLSGVCVVMLWRFWPKPTMKTLMGVCVLFAVVFVAGVLIAPNLRGDRVIMLDVGQGDAFLVQSRGCNVLIDTGNHDAELLEGLARQGVIHLDGVVISHKDDDHCGSLAALAESVQVDCVIVASDVSACGCASCGKLIECAETVTQGDIRYVNIGDTVAVGNFMATVIWPHAFQDKGGNADSLCLTLDHDADGNGVHDAGEWRMLFTGDAECNEVAAMIADGSVGDIDVLKVGHHGSRVSLDEATAAILDPEIALISVGADNSYGHPTEEVLGYLSACAAQVYRSDLDGDVTVTFRDGGIYVST